MTGRQPATKADLELLYLRTRTDLAEFKAAILKWFIRGALVVQAAVIVGVVAALLRWMPH